MKSNPFAALRPKRVKKVASAKKEAMPAHGDSDVVVETERERVLAQALKMAEDATEKAEGKVDLMEQKLQGKDRQKLPPIVAARISAVESAEKFSTVCEGNHYLDMQVIAHIYAQALDKKPHVKEGEKEENTKVPPEYGIPAPGGNVKAGVCHLER
jgi:RNA-splicing ligase RtcB